VRLEIYSTLGLDRKVGLTTKCGVTQRCARGARVSSRQPLSKFDCLINTFHSLRFDIFIFLIILHFFPGFLIALVAILISVGVGLIVHFAENRPLECSFPDTYVEGQSKTQQQQKDSQGNVLEHHMKKK
jgi:hypothetical protein